MNDEAKEISDLILRKISKSNYNIVPSPDNGVILMYDNEMNNLLMKVEKFGSEISIVDKYHAFRFNFGSDEDSMNTIWNKILDNLNFKNL